VGRKSLQLWKFFGKYSCFWAGNFPISAWQVKFGTAEVPNFTLIHELCHPCGAKNRKIGHLSNFNTGGCPAGNYMNLLMPCCQE